MTKTLIPNSILDIAFKTAKTSEGAGRNGCYKCAAVIFNKRKVLKVGINKSKTHPLLDPYTEYPHLHAETDAIINSRGRIKGASILVVRTNRQGTSRGMSRPCEVCTKMIRRVGIKRVYWYDWNGELRKENF